MEKEKCHRNIRILRRLYDGEWGKLQFDFESGTAEIVRLADGDAVKTYKFTNVAI